MTTEHNTDKSLAELQRLCGAWSDYNFGSNRKTSYQPLYGIIEEFGELVHSQLKMEQNIRGSAEEHMAKIRDAVGDIVFYLMDYLHRMKIPVPGGWPAPPDDAAQSSKSWLNTVNSHTIQGIIFQIQDIITKMGMNHEFYGKELMDISISASRLLVWLNAYCYRSDINMKEAVWETALQVFERDWRKFPKNGRTE